MSKTKAIIGIGLVFFLGMVSGVALTMKFVQHRIEDLTEGGPQELGEIIVRRLDHQLELDAKQRARVREIVSEARGQIAAVKSRFQPEIFAVVEASATQIRSQLTPEQAAKFDAIAARGREEWTARLRSQEGR